jgi:hypothetical protein
MDLSPVPRSCLRDLAPLCVAVLVSIVWPSAVRAQTRPARTGAIEGTVTTQGGTIPLGGAGVGIRNASDVEIAAQATDADGRFRVSDLAPGPYRVAVSLEAFSSKIASVVVVEGRTVRVDFDLPVALVAPTVEVVAPAVTTTGGGLGQSEGIEGKDADVLAPGGGVSGALRLLASVIELPGGLSIKGGRPSQAGMQIGSSMFTDPSLGLAHINLPGDAIESVSVLPNPYAVEYGRFSSGLVVIQTRRAGDKWKIRLNSLDPAFRTERYHDWKVVGIQSVNPRVEVGGPLIKDRLWLEQTAQYRYSTDEVPSLPPDQRRTTNAISSFTRIDANLSSQHSLIVTTGFFPGITTYASLGTFTPPPATVDVRDNVYHVAATERAVWNTRLLSETSFQVDQYRTSVSPQGSAPMILRPEGADPEGNFFNTQERNPLAFQFIQAVSSSFEGPLGQHVVKGGVDVISSHYSGTSVSKPVLIYRQDGTLTRRLDFSSPTDQDVRSTDVALFVQDRVQPSMRWFFEGGARLDRDGILARWNLTPRLGAAVLLNATGTSVLRGGFGLFFERTPSVAGAFKQFETTTDTRFAADGVTPLGPPVAFPHVVAPDVLTARSATWDVSYDYRVNTQWSIHASVLEREGAHELLVEPLQAGGVGQLLLSSAGRSQYRNVEFGFQYTTAAAELNVTYARSMARSDYNAFSNYFDAMLQPVIEPNAYAPASTDVPNRLFARGHVLVTPRWLLLGTFDWRTGVPYSAVNEALEFVGPRNELRFPYHLLVDFGVEHRFKVGKFQPWIGIIANNVFDFFLPSDVQNNLGSPAFGALYNSPYRQLRLQIRFER